MKNILVIIMLVFTSNILYAQTGQAERRKLQTQREQEDFNEKVQGPFDKAYQIFKDRIKELSGGEDNAMGFLEKIPDSLNPIDSLRAALYAQTYKNAVITYQISTIEWICSHTNSFRTPNLIIRWWPSAGRELIYKALSVEVKRSNFGQSLKKLIENPPKTK